MKKKLDMQGFAEITQRVIARDGFDRYLPTLCLPERQHLAVLEGVPEEKQSEIRTIAISWANKKANATEEYFLAYKQDSERFRIIHRHAEGVEEDAFLAE